MAGAKRPGKGGPDKRGPGKGKPGRSKPNKDRPGKDRPVSGRKRRARPPAARSGRARPVPGTEAPRAKPAPRLELAVWQFVRIMVRLEDRAAAKRGPARGSVGSSVYGAWRQRWRELDERLAALGRSNAEGFADLMMRQKVVIEDATPAQRAEVARVLGEVIDQLKSAIKDSAGDEARTTDLRFERKELEALRARLRKRRR